MQPTREQPRPSAEWQIEGGCPLCGGPLSVRAREESGAWSYCPTCKWISHPQIRMGPQGMALMHPVAAA